MTRGPRRPPEKPADREAWEKFTAGIKKLDQPARIASQPQLSKPEETAGRAILDQSVSPAVAGPPAPLDRADRRKIGRGSLRVDARIDLHGMTQATAHRRLLAFLQQAQMRGERLVIVITGKGSSDSDGDDSWRGRGVLRRSVPLWLEEPAFRNVVAALSPAAQRHGGEGAFYIRLRAGSRPHAL